VGVLFVGAGHDVGACLAPDVLVQSFKNSQKVLHYIYELLLGKDPREVEALAQYIAAPADVL
jgi:hypothetical protein